MEYPERDNPVVITIRFSVLSTPPHCRNTWCGWSGLAIVFTPVKVYLSFFNLTLLQGSSPQHCWPSTAQQSTANWRFVCNAALHSIPLTQPCPTARVWPDPQPTEAAFSCTGTITTLPACWQRQFTPRPIPPTTYFLIPPYFSTLTAFSLLDLKELTCSHVRNVALPRFYNTSSQNVSSAQRTVKYIESMKTWFLQIRLSSAHLCFYWHSMITDTSHNFNLDLFIWLSPVISESSRHISGCPVLFRLLALFSLFMIPHDTDQSGAMVPPVSAFYLQCQLPQHHGTMHSHSAHLPDSHFRRLAQFPVPQITEKLILHHSPSLPSHTGKIFRVLPKKNNETSLTDTRNSCSKWETEQELKFVLFPL